MPGTKEGNIADVSKWEEKDHVKINIAADRKDIELSIEDASKLKIKYKKRLQIIIPKQKESNSSDTNETQPVNTTSIPKEQEYNTTDIDKTQPVNTTSIPKQEENSSDTNKTQPMNTTSIPKQQESDSFDTNKTQPVNTTSIPKQEEFNSSDANNTQPVNITSIPKQQESNSSDTSKTQPVNTISIPKQQEFKNSDTNKTDQFVNATSIPMQEESNSSDTNKTQPLNATNNSPAANTSYNPEVTTDESEKGARKGGSSEQKGNETMLENVMTKLKLCKGTVIAGFIAFSLGFLLRPKFKVAGH